ncbi:Os02g0666550 [Oryza sativa Japonica Group]|uniref:Os02g0666550 protein n=1 Tax=Oryza sativa subsp. japonica TaxID=39947 RepID=A0A0P0VMU2_ORYSJ|nr:hypothetical protein EE612_012891 [Oryza sativa]BAS80190.1 Os02g0666550 [Oryza sativa Japonica Group]
MHVWYVPPARRRLAAIHSCMFSACCTSPGRLPTTGHTRGPLSPRDIRQNHVMYAAATATTTAHVPTSIFLWQQTL